MLFIWFTFVCATLYMKISRSLYVEFDSYSTVLVIIGFVCYSVGNKSFMYIALLFPIQVE